ncbi:zinc finger FYVE domain-containing protein 9 [Coccinella septempunctata]|uniref:zinc finger FYVE domain-containing protein 9 n=1 Tax=Coccinella septempunctata TaxID=41139 RepID=UPI001D093590|nr:zinc finger FYVE domain-containing protein 9 [Coccinella septempunctata]
MDKYTVDLDKVLNDFEYSEYSLESAKVNRNIQNENPNTSFNTNPCSRNDTSAKHSINNVFHSLNEYLSSDITPKKIESMHNNFKGITIPQDSQASTFSVKPQPFIPPKVLSQTLDNTHQVSLESTFHNEFQGVKQIDRISEEVSYDFNESFVHNIDTHSDTCAIIPNQEILEGKCETNIVDIPVTNTLDNKCLQDETPENGSSKYCPQNSVESNCNSAFVTSLDNEIPEEILVDVSSENSFCNNSIPTSQTTENKDNESEERTKNNIIDLEDNEVRNEENIIDSVKNEVSSKGLIENTECDTRSDSILEPESIEQEEKNEMRDQKIQLNEEKSEATATEIEKIGFDTEVEIDEENIDQYFHELEKELGIQNQESEKNEYSDMTNHLDNIDPDIQDIDLKTEKKDEENEKTASAKEEHLKTASPTLDLQKNEVPIEIEIPSNEKILEKQEPSSEESSEDNKIQLNKSNENHSTEIDEESTQIDPPKSIGEAEGDLKSDQLDDFSTKIGLNPSEASNVPESHQVIEESQESGKNSRPQILTLSEEVQEKTRKINLIGEPGSTPYNNLYSTKDFSKTITDDRGDHNTDRARSPTYSDVSTDSVSSGSSDGAAKQNDAISEVQKDEIKSDLTLKETMQNNMVNPVETSRSDITMDKDFKNNLKTSNVRTEDGASTSSTKLEESVKVDNEQEVEGACAMDTETNNRACQENLDKEEEGIVGSSCSGGIDWLGKQAPLWIPDNEAMSCLHCDMKFTVIKRRHHCRACGLVLCSNCCSLKYHLEYLNAVARVCKKCFDILVNNACSNSGSETSQESSSPSRNLNATQDNLGPPNPNNPLEYCSTIPPTQQVDPGALSVPSVMVPVGVLKRKGSNKGRSNKSVMFCDGIRPGSDLTNLDTDFNYSEKQKSEKLKKSPEKSTKTGRNLDLIDSESKSFIPSDEKSLPPTVTILKTDNKYSPCANNSSVVEMLKNESLTFALQSNVFVHVKIINMDCCVSRIAWCFSTEGLINVGQDEIVILLEFSENESSVPKEIFEHLNYVYLEAVKGSSVKELGMSLHPNSPFLGSKNHFGFIYIRPTFQCLQNVIIPKEPYLIGILIHRWETPWAKLFPLRLILRLGAEYKYYPSPIISTRDRDSVFVEIGHTIINILADFRNFSYTLPQIRGLTIHMEDKNTTVTIPKNRYDQILKSLSNSSDHILAFAGNFSSAADSHLVCIQDTQSATNNYSTHAINICNQPRKVTGASFIVFNGALKSTSGLTAKSNIVEDGLMIQILPEHLLQVRDSLKNMKNHTIQCGCINEESDETVTIVWGEPDTSFNVGVISPIDNKDLTGIPSIRVHNGKDYTCNSGNRLIRWTEVFISQSGEDQSKNQDTVDISKISENISKATCQALVKYLDLLVSNSFYKIGLRAHIHIENVSYSAGSNNVKLPPIYMKSLDNELIPVLHRLASNNVTDQPIVLELIFRILKI